MTTRGLILIFLLIFAMTSMANDTRTYSGILDVGRAQLTLRINITPEGCTLDSPDQGAYAIPLEIHVLSPDSIFVLSTHLSAEYHASIVGDTLKGQFSQRGFSYPLTLIRKDIVDSRPQTPQPPFPYTVIDTIFDNPQARIRLAGTIVVPQERPKAMVVFISGSGPQNRDEEIFGHSPFLVMADYLARAGIASLRYDDRGVGESTGDFASATTMDFSSDAKAALDFADSLGYGMPGIIGHSEGGSIAFMAASSRPVAFVVSMAGAVLPGKEIILAQNRHSLRNSGLPSSQIDDVMHLLDVAFDKIADGENPSFRTLSAKLNIDIPDGMMEMLEKSDVEATPWYRLFIKMDPRQYISQVKSRVFAIGGDRDTQVVAEDNIGALEEILPDAVTMIYPHLNHLFQHCSTGEVSEYGKIEETISQSVLSDIVDFILSDD